MAENTRLIDGVKYLQLHNLIEFKKISLEDNVYFTLRDIFLNYGYIDDVLRANDFNGKLTNNISYEERTENFEYADLLMDENFLSSLIEWIKRIHISEFEFETPEQYLADCDTSSKKYLDELDWYYNVDMSEYIALDDWINNLNKLILELEIQLEKVKLMKQEDLDRDIERLEELKTNNK